MYLKRILYCLSLFVVGLSAVAASGQSAFSGTEIPQLSSLDLDVRVDYESERIAGKAILTLRNLSAAPLSRVPLLLNRLMRVEAVQSSNGNDLIFHQKVTAFEDVDKWQVNAIEVELARPVQPEGTVEIEVAFGGYLVGYTEVGMRYVRDHVDRDFTILREDALAFPVVGVPLCQRIEKIALVLPIVHNAFYQNPDNRFRWAVRF
jgi:hypothetical protein